MGAILRVDVESAEVEQFFADLGKRAAGPEGFLGYVGGDAVRKFRENIDRESGGPDFPAWAQLAASTVKERERLGYGGAHPMLKRTLDLYGHLIGGPATVTGLSVTAGTDGSLVYPEVHDAGEGGQHQRSFIWLDDPTIEGWLEVLAQFLVEAKAPPAVAA